MQLVVVFLLIGCLCSAFGQVPVHTKPALDTQCENNETMSTIVNALNVSGRCSTPTSGAWPTFEIGFAAQPAAGTPHRVSEGTINALERLRNKVESILCNASLVFYSTSHQSTNADQTANTSIFYADFNARCPTDGGETPLKREAARVVCQDIIQRVSTVRCLLQIADEERHGTYLANTTGLNQEQLSYWDSVKHIANDLNLFAVAKDLMGNGPSIITVKTGQTVNCHPALPSPNNTRCEAYDSYGFDVSMFMSVATHPANPVFKHALAALDTEFVKYQCGLARVEVGPSAIRSYTATGEVKETYIIKINISQQIDTDPYPNMAGFRCALQLSLNSDDRDEKGYNEALHNATRKSGGLGVYYISKLNELPPPSDGFDQTPVPSPSDYVSLSPAPTIHPSEVDWAARQTFNAQCAATGNTVATEDHAFMEDCSWIPNHYVTSAPHFTFTMKALTPHADTVRYEIFERFLNVTRDVLCGFPEVDVTPVYNKKATDDYAELTVYVKAICPHKSEKFGGCDVLAERLNLLRCMLSYAMANHWPDGTTQQTKDQYQVVMDETKTLNITAVGNSLLPIVLYDDMKYSDAKTCKEVAPVLPPASLGKEPQCLLPEGFEVPTTLDRVGMHFIVDSLPTNEYEELQHFETHLREYFCGYYNISLWADVDHNNNYVAFAVDCLSPRAYLGYLYSDYYKHTKRVVPMLCSQAAQFMQRARCAFMLSMDAANKDLEGYDGSFNVAASTMNVLWVSDVNKFPADDATPFWMRNFYSPVDADQTHHNGDDTVKRDRIIAAVIGVLFAALVVTVLVLMIRKKMSEGSGSNPSNSNKKGNNMKFEYDRGRVTSNDFDCNSDDERSAAQRYAAEAESVPVELADVTPPRPGTTDVNAHSENYRMGGGNMYDTASPDDVAIRINTRDEGLQHRGEFEDLRGSMDRAADDLDDDGKELPPPLPPHHNE